MQKIPCIAENACFPAFLVVDNLWIIYSPEISAVSQMAHALFAMLDAVASGGTMRVSDGANWKACRQSPMTRTDEQKN